MSLSRRELLGGLLAAPLVYAVAPLVPEPSEGARIVEWLSDGRALVEMWWRDANWARYTARIAGVVSEQTEHGFTVDIEAGALAPIVPTCTVRWNGAEWTAYE